METEICTRILPARGRGPDRRFAFPRVETRCMALGWGRMPDARSVVCALRQRIVVWQWLVLIGLAGAANAAGSNMPWEAPLELLLESIQGPVARIIAVIIIIVTGLTLAFGDTAGGFRRLIQIVFGLSIAFAASSRSEEHTSELQSLMRISYAVFCLQKKKTQLEHIR